MFIFFIAAAVEVEWKPASIPFAARARTFHTGAEIPEHPKKSSAVVGVLWRFISDAVVAIIENVEKSISTVV